jgi:nucleoside-diphosphate-sugar epimerase
MGRQRVLITGGTGFIGRHVVAAALARGWQVCLLGRRASQYPETQFIPWDLAIVPPVERLTGVSSLIHLAADLRLETEAIRENAEVDSARFLFAALPPNTRIVFISSQSSNLEAPTRYGRVKARIEALVGEHNGVVLRPGLVFGGDQNAGLHARLCRIVRILPIILDLRPATLVQPIHVDDLAEAILRVASRNVSPGVYCVGDANGISMTAYLRAIARLRYGLWRPSIPTPKILIWMLARYAQSMLRAINLDQQNMLGLMALKRMETAASLRVLELDLRPFRDGLRPNGSCARRELLMEGRALLTFVTGQPPPVGVLKRYVLAVEVVDGGQPLSLSTKFVAWPALLRLVEDRGLLQRSSHPDLERRLEIATRVAEASVTGAQNFMATKATTSFMAYISLSAVLALELFWHLVRLGLRPSLRDND